MIESSPKPRRAELPATTPAAIARVVGRITGKNSQRQILEGTTSADQLGIPHHGRCDDTHALILVEWREKLERVPSRNGSE